MIFGIVISKVGVRSKLTSTSYFQLRETDLWNWKCNSKGKSMHQNKEKKRKKLLVPISIP